jgi:hypothetical protein
MFVFSCASTGRPEHGTRKTSPIYSFGTRGGLTKWKNYYKNLTFDDIKAILPLDDIFSVYRCYYDSKHNDLMFWGIKKGLSFNIPIPEYDAPFTTRVDSIENVSIPDEIIIRPQSVIPPLAVPVAVPLTKSLLKPIAPAGTPIVKPIVQPQPFVLPVKNPPIEQTPIVSLPPQEETKVHNSEVENVVGYDDLTEIEREIVNRYLNQRNN